MEFFHFFFDIPVIDMFSFFLIMPEDLVIDMSLPSWVIEMPGQNCHPNLLKSDGPEIWYFDNTFL